MRKLIEKFLPGKTPKKKNSANPEVQQMIQGIHKLHSQTVKDVIVPRIDVVAIDDELSNQEILDLAIKSTFSRFPVYHGTIDNIIGLVYVKDLLKVSQNIETVDISTISRNPFFVTETMRLDILLREMQKRRIHIAIVVDEYGGVSGVVCLEDIIEEIVGEIQDEFDNDDEEFIKISNNVYLVDGRLSLAKFNTVLPITLPDDEIDTVGGLVYSLFERIPVRYEKISYSSGTASVDFIVQTMIGNKIKSIKVVINDVEK